MSGHVYTAECSHCLTPVEFFQGEQLEDCCDGAFIDRLRRLAEEGDFPGLLEALDVDASLYPWSLLT